MELNHKLTSLNKEYNLKVEHKKSIVLKFEQTITTNKTTSTNITEQIENHKFELSKLYATIEKYEELLINSNKEINVELDKEQLIFLQEQERTTLKIKDLKLTETERIDDNNKLITLLKSNNNNILSKINNIQLTKKNQINNRAKERLKLQNNIDTIKETKKQKKKQLLYYNNNIMIINEKINDLHKIYQEVEVKKSNANYIFYEIKQDIKNIQLEIETTNTYINKLMRQNTHGNIDDVEESTEMNLLKSIEHLEKLNTDLEACYNKPEYNLDTFYKNIENDNMLILKELDTLNNNKEQLMMILEKERTKSDEQQLNHISSKEFKTDIIDNNTLFKKEIKQLQTRLDDNYINIALIENENDELHEFYSIQYRKEDCYDKNSHKRLRIATTRIHSKFDIIQTDLNTHIIKYQTNLLHIKNDIQRLHKNKLDIEIENNKCLLDTNKNKNELDIIITHIYNKIIIYKKKMVQNR